MNISIVIVSYNVKEYIISCIESIYKHSKARLSFEIIVVDNNSEDGSQLELKKRFSKILLIENDYNAGFSVAVNQGVKKCKGKYIFLLNPDTLFLEDTLHKLFQKNEKNEKIGAIGPESLFIGLYSNTTPSDFIVSTNSINAGVPITLTYFSCLSLKGLRK